MLDKIIKFSKKLYDSRPIRISQKDIDGIVLQTKKKVIDQIDKKIVELENKRNKPKQNPDECKLLEVEGVPYYPAKIIDKIDSEIWLEWRKWIENLKDDSK